MSASNLPSLETLAVELNIPALQRMATEGHTTQSVSQMKFGQVGKKYGVSAEEYMRLKAYFTAQSSNSGQSDSVPTNHDTASSVSTINQKSEQQEPKIVHEEQQDTLLMADQPAQVNHSLTGQPQPSVIEVNPPTQGESIVCSVISGAVICSLFTPFLGIVAFCIGNRRQKGGWLIGSGIGGFINSMLHIAVAIAFDITSNHYTAYSNGGSSSSYTNYYTKGMTSDLHIAAIVFYVIAGLTVILSAVEFRLGTRMIRNETSPGQDSDNQKAPAADHANNPADNSV